MFLQLDLVGEGRDLVDLLDRIRQNTALELTVVDDLLAIDLLDIPVLSDEKFNPCLCRQCSRQLLVRVDVAVGLLEQ